MSRPRRHHLVPQFLLSRFAKRDKLIMVSREDAAKAIPVSVSNAAVQTDFYTTETDAGPSTEVESMLSKIEANAAVALKRLEGPGGFPLGADDREHLAVFMSLQMQRGEDSREALCQMNEHLLKMALAMMTPEMVRDRLREMNGRDPSEEDVTKTRATLRAWDKYKIETHPNEHIGTMLQVGVELVPHFLARSWQLFTFPTPMLLTGDHPVTLTGRPQSRHHGIGLENAEAVLFPIDPQRALVLTVPGRLERVVACDEKAARFINVRIAHHCYRWIFHRPTHHPLAGVKLQPRMPGVVSGIGAGDRFKPSRA